MACEFNSTLEFEEQPVMVTFSMDGEVFSCEVLWFMTVILRGFRRSSFFPDCFFISLDHLYVKIARFVVICIVMLNVIFEVCGLEWCWKLEDCQLWLPSCS